MEPRYCGTTGISMRAYKFKLFPDYFPDAARVSLLPGSYRARIYYAHLDSLSEDGLDGNDEYRVVLWPAPPSGLKILKARGHKVGE